jgi:hypothetical protein
MKNLSIKLVIILMIVFGISTLSSCKKDECECPEEINTNIHSYERTIIVRFNVPESSGKTRVVISGTLYGYEEDSSGVLPNPEIKSFSIDETGVTGHYQNNNFVSRTQNTALRSGGEPVPGAEIIIEQEPNDDPVAPSNVITDPDNATFIIDAVFDPGTYHIRATSTSITTKGGFAVGGFSAT